MFWNSVIQFQGKIICSNGNTAIFKILNDIAGVLYPDDELYVCYDTINRYSSVQGSGVTANLAVIKNTLHMFKAVYKVKCYILKDLCFEAMLLRLSNIIPVITDQNVAWLQAFVTEVYKNNNTAYPQTYTDKLFNNARMLKKTNEEYVASVLHDVTCKTHLKVTKGTLDRCWTCDCGVQTVNCNNMYVYYDWINSNDGVCRAESKQVCCLCGHLFTNTKNIKLFTKCKQGYKRDKILFDLCNSDWHNLFTTI